MALATLTLNGLYGLYLFRRARSSTRLITDSEA